MSEIRTSAMLWIIKILVAFSIFWHTGIIQNVINEAEEGKLPPHLAEIRRKEAESFAHYRVAMTKVQVENGVAYSPYDYFRDLIEIGNKEKKLGVRAPIRPWIDALNELMWKGINDGYYSRWDIGNAREIHGLEADRASGLINRREAQWKGINWKALFSWFFWFYLQNLFPAFALYFAWTIEDRRNRDISRLPNPFYFLWQVLAHPVYLTRVVFVWFNDTGRQVFAEARYRQMKENFFVYLSEKDTKKIENFVQSTRSLSSWYDELLSEGLKPVHSLAAALLVTMIFTVLPRPVEACKIHLPDTVSQTILEQSSIHLPRENMESMAGYFGASHHGNFMGIDSFLGEEIDFQVASIVARLQEFIIVFRPQEVWCDISHVPILVV